MRVDPKIEIECGPRVYEPAEDSYLLLDAIEITPGQKVLEMGCGSGLLSLHCSKYGAETTAVDIDPLAVESTRNNAVRNNLQIDIKQSDLFEQLKEKYNLIIFNPPYLPDDEFQDIKWSGGRSGIETTLRFLRDCGDYLKPGGRIMIVQSSLADRTRFEEEVGNLGYDMITIREKRMFFESIFVHELKRSK